MAKKSENREKLIIQEKITILKFLKQHTGRAQTELAEKYEISPGRTG